MPTTSDLLRSHHKLRAALIIAGKRIRKLNVGQKDKNSVLPLLRKVLRESRVAAKSFREERSG
jgi:hypothetical protein